MDAETIVDTRALRDAFGCFATGITVVTTLSENGTPVGITANSFTSVSLDPPLLLWCLDRRSTTYGVFSSCKIFVITVLDAGATAVASRFAMKDGHTVGDQESVPTEMGPPTFPGALAVFECDMQARYDGGDHVVMLGLVRRFKSCAEAERNAHGPLLYYRGRYRALASPTG